MSAQTWNRTKFSRGSVECSAIELSGRLKLSIDQVLSVFNYLIKLDHRTSILKSLPGGLRQSLSPEG